MTRSFGSPRQTVTYVRTGGEVLAYLGRGFGVVRIPDLPVAQAAPNVRSEPATVRVDEPERSDDA